MIYELRIYYICPGKTEALCDRFKTHTLRIFARHGIKVKNFWLDAEGKEILYYLCEFESIEAKEAAWKTFLADPEWIYEKGESEKNGALVERGESFVLKDAAFFSEKGSIR